LAACATPTNPKHNANARTLIQIFMMNLRSGLEGNGRPPASDRSHPRSRVGERALVIIFNATFGAALA
jgi:hypothetical protein